MLRLVSISLLCVTFMTSLPGWGEAKVLHPMIESPFELNASFDFERIRQRLDQVLHQHDLDLWYPRVIDREFGGYLSHFDYRWEPGEPQDKMVVTQARHVWTLATAAEFLGEKEPWKAHALHGLEFLRERMWDPEHGGFHWLVRRDGEPLPNGNGDLLKVGYGQAFVIYGAAAVCRVFGDPDALDLARRTFAWLEDHAHDKQYGGYFDRMDVTGKPFPDGYADVPPKDYNSSIHLLEAFAELYRVWPDPLLRERLNEMFLLVRDTITDPRGFLNLYFTRDWKHVVRHSLPEPFTEAEDNVDFITFGHDVETAYLLIEASEVLGRDDHAETVALGKRMVEHALAFGWDTELGGFYEGGFYMPDDAEPTIFDDRKNWWGQVEGYHTLLLMAELHPDQRKDFLELAERQWAYIEAYLLDAEHGGWFTWGVDASPDAIKADKAQIWKAGYHTVRGVVHSIRILEGLAGEP